MPSRFKRVRSHVSGFLKGETFDRHLSRVWCCKNVVLIEAVLLIVFANLPALPALAAHKFMLDLWQSQRRSTDQTNREKRTPDREVWCGGGDPQPIGIALKYQ
jgi:hypothetical protein